MTKVVAKISLAVIAVALMLGNYWFTFGMWPRSWWAFVLFALGAILVTGLNAAIDRDNE